MIEREHRIPWHPPDYSGVCEPGVHELVGGLQTRSSLAHLRIYKYPQNPREYGRVFERSSDILQKHLLPDLALGPVGVRSLIFWTQLPMAGSENFVLLCLLRGEACIGRMSTRIQIAASKTTTPPATVTRNVVLFTNTAQNVVSVF